MENNLENKATFFSQYLLQKVFVTEKGVSFLIPGFLRDINKCDYLQLKSISDISDEDAIGAIDLFQNHISDDSIKAVQGRQLINDFRLGNLNRFGLTVWDLIKIADYLRSRSFLIEFNGLSTEELISRGWAVIK